MPRPKKSEETQNDFVSAVGRRKGAVARIRLYSKKESVSWGEVVAKKGDMLVNGKPAQEYFSNASDLSVYTEPLRITNLLGKTIVTVKIVGGGMSGQLDAAIHGLSRALAGIDPKNRALLKKRGFLTRDSRVRQRRKVGMGGKSRRKKQSPKR